MCFESLNYEFIASTKLCSKWLQQIDNQFLFDKLSELINVAYGDVCFGDAIIKNHVSNNDVEPLLTWINHLIRNGLFISFVVLLLALESQIHFRLGYDNYRNKIVLKLLNIQLIE